MPASPSQKGWATVAAMLAIGGCELPTIEVVVPVGDQVVVEATVVLTVDPTDASRSTTHLLAITTRYPDGGHPHAVHGASVRVTGESGRSVQLSEEADPVADCVNRDFFGSCYRATAPSGIFAPGERLSLEVVLPDGGVVRGVSRMPGTFSAVGLSLEDGRCRLTPDTNYRFRWTPVAGAAAYIGEIGIGGVGDLDVEDRTYWTVTFVGGDMTEVVFPRGLVAGLADVELARVLHTGLPQGAVADFALGAIDLNWTNWIREGRINVNGRVRVPSVFGDGTGWFGSAMRWRLSMESREANGDQDLPLCGPAVVN